MAQRILTEEMVEACAPAVAVENNPGVMLGIVLGEAAKSGRDKVTIITSPAISDLGAWLEQLLAESTGKQGHGIIPVDRETLSSPEVYGNDRMFAYLRFEPQPDADQDAKVAALGKAGHPVIRIAVQDIYDLGQEFFRWEIATAVAGSIIGINAFNQPDVEASKVETRKLTSEYEKTGSLRSEKPVFEEKMLFALLWNRNLHEFWRQELGEKFFNRMLRLVPYTWLVDPSPLPPARLLGLILAESWWERVLQPIQAGLNNRARMLQFGAIMMLVALWVIWWRQ